MRRGRRPGGNHAWRAGCYRTRMGLIAWFERLLSKEAKPDGPAPSVFGAGADRRLAEEAAARDYELEVVKGKGRPRGA